MKILLDTHILSWFVDDSALLSETEKAQIEGDNDLRLSIASLWEIAIKVSLGKLRLGLPLVELMTRQLTSNGIAVLPITTGHVMRVASLPYHHRDPFDRIIVSQAMVERIPILSADAALDPYGITRLW